MAHTALIENSTKKPNIFMSILTTCLQSLKKFHDRLKKTLNFVIIKKYFSGFSCFLWKLPKSSGYKMKPQCQQPKGNNQNKKKRKCYILFNPPYSVSVKTSIGRTFIKLISKHSLPNHKFVETFNNKTKPSYSCMPNIRSKINGHIKKCYNTSPQSSKNYATVLSKKIALWMDYV